VKIILDTDIASVFAKVERIDLLSQLFGKRELCITPRVYEELLVPLRYGYDFPNRIFSGCRLIIPTSEETGEFTDLLLKEPRLGRGELESITICKSRNYIFATIDRLSLDFAKSQKVRVVSLHSILKALWVSGNLSKEQVLDLIRQIERKDKTKIKGIEGIFKS